MSSADADPDFDGIANAVEMVIGSTPSTCDFSVVDQAFIAPHMKPPPNPGEFPVKRPHFIDPAR